MENEINSVIKDLEMLKDGTWVPDDDSCDASIEMLERAKTKFDKMYSEEDMEKSFEAGRGYHEHLEMQKAKYFEPDEIHKIDYKKYSFAKWFEQFKKK